MRIRNGMCRCFLHIRSGIFLFLSIIITFGCGERKKRYEAPEPMEVPLSYLSFRVTFPVQEMEQGVNKILPRILIDGPIGLNGKEDTLYLKVIRDGDLDLSVRNTTLYASIPLKIRAAIKKKVMGISFTNVDTPLEFSGEVRVSADISLSENWEMAISCRWLGIDWKDKPQFSILGFTLNLDDIIENTLDKHQEYLSGALCEAVQKAVRFRESLNQVWMDLQEPFRIADKPLGLWMYFRPDVLKGKLLSGQQDALAVHLEYRTEIHIVPGGASIASKVPLPGRGEPFHNRPALLAYPEVNIPMSFIRETLAAELKDKEFSYEGYSSRLKEIDVSAAGQRLQVTLEAEGDFNGTVSVRGRPALDKDLNLVMDDFSFDIEVEDIGVKMTDWAVHSFAEQYIAEQVKIETGKLLNNLDSLAMAGISNTDLGEKMVPSIRFDKISSYQLVFTEDMVRWVFYVEGEAELGLREGLISKK